jgi:hypothetical protein
VRIKTIYLLCFSMIRVIERGLFLKANEAVLMLFRVWYKVGWGEIT